MRKIITIIAISIAAAQLSAQTYEWTQTFGGTDGDYGYSVAVDANGNIYSAGYYQGTVDFDPGSGTDSHTSNGGVDIFVQKMDANGNFLWAKTFGGTDYDKAYSVAVDANGNVVVTGEFYGTVDFDPGSGTDNHTSNGSGSDIFVQKMDANGNFLWARTFGSSGYNPNVGNCVKFDANGNVYVTGWFADTVDFDPGAGVDNHISNGGADIFVLKLDANGDFQWAKTFGGTGWDRGYGITVDDSENVYTTGSFLDVVDFDPNSGTDNHTSTGLDIFIQKLNSNGDYQWTKTFGGSNDDEGLAIVTDASGNIYTTGDFEDTADFDPTTNTDNHTSNGETDIFIQKLDANGNFLWAKTFGGSDYDKAYSIAVDANGNVYTAGYYQGTVDFDPGSGTDNHSSNGGYDAFTQKLDTYGDYVWANTFGANAYDYGRSIAVDANNNIYTTGYFKNTVDFDPTANTDNHTSNGETDIFIQKMSQTTTYVTDNGSEKQINVYPNPTKGHVVINLDKKYEKVSVNVTDVIGKTVKTFKFDDTQEINLNLDSHKGVYFIEVNTGKNKTIFKLLKE